MAVLGLRSTVLPPASEAAVHAEEAQRKYDETDNDSESHWHRISSSRSQNRLEGGHGEADTMLSGKRHDSTAALAVLHERKTRFTRLRKIPNLRPSTMAKALKKMGRKLSLKTLTFDNGIENKHHESVALCLRIQTFFCNAYHSWEKGGVENTIGRIRRFIPKGANLADYSDEDIAMIEYWLNHTPRKCLNYQTPYQRMSEYLLSISPQPNYAFEG